MGQLFRCQLLSPKWAIQAMAVQAASLAGLGLLPHASQCIGLALQDHPCDAYRDTVTALRQQRLHPVTVHICELGFGKKSSEQP